jgi:hypothetical protein
MTFVATLCLVGAAAGLIQRNPDCEACFRLQGGLPAAVTLVSGAAPWRGLQEQACDDWAAAVSWSCRLLEYVSTMLGPAAASRP